MARIETPAREPTLNLEITSSWRRKRNRGFSSWQCGIPEGHQGRKGSILGVEG